MSILYEKKYVKYVHSFNIKLLATKPSFAERRKTGGVCGEKAPGGGGGTIGVFAPLEDC